MRNFQIFRPQRFPKLLRSSKISAICIPLILMLILPSLSVCQPDDSWNFADYLYQLGEYEKSETEYFRFIYKNSEAERIPEAYFMIGKCNQELGDWEKAIDYFRLSYETYPQSKWADESVFESARSFAELGAKRRARSEFALLQTQYPDSDLSDDSEFMIGLSYLGEYRWNAGERVFARFPSIYPESEFSPLAQSLQTEAAAAQNLPRRSPIVGGILSTLIPGTGQMYAGKHWDGLMALVVNGALAYATVHSWENDNEPSAYFFGWFGLSFYFGNIYGGINAPKRFNREQQAKHLRRIERKVINDME